MMSNYPHGRWSYGTSVPAVKKHEKFLCVVGVWGFEPRFVNALLILPYYMQ